MEEEEPKKKRSIETKSKQEGLGLELILFKRSDQKSGRGERGINKWERTSDLPLLRTFFGTVENALMFSTAVCVYEQDMR